MGYRIPRELYYERVKRERRLEPEPLNVIITPVSVTIGDARVTIVEVTKVDLPLNLGRRYIVSCFIEWGGWRSRVFPLVVSSEEELVSRLRTEIAKAKLSVAAGYTEPFVKVK